MSKHTPGPWKVDKVIRAKYDELSGEKKPDEVSLFIYPDNVKKENFNLAAINTYCVPESEANARLIAAAPDLLEALKDALEFIRPQYGYDCRLADLLKRADAAIAKATSSGGAAE